MISKFSPPWNFTLTWNVHKDQMISKVPRYDVEPAGPEVVQVTH
jgi:hypothetical protein